MSYTTLSRFHEPLFGNTPVHSFRLVAYLWNASDILVDRRIHDKNQYNTTLTENKKCQAGLSRPFILARALYLKWLLSWTFNLLQVLIRRGVTQCCINGWHQNTVYVTKIHTFYIQKEQITVKQQQQQNPDHGRWAAWCHFLLCREKAYNRYMNTSADVSKF
jgi:hypothetical protein